MAFKPIEILINAKDNASSVFSSLQGKVAAVGAAIATYFGINAFVGVVQGAADLEQAMSRVQAATGASGDEMAALRKAAEDAGASTKFTSTEAAGALENLAKAGLNAADAVATLPAVLNLAAAGDIGLAESAEVVTKAVMGMGLAFSDAARVADVLDLGAKSTNTSVLGLAQALSYAAPVANSLGLSLESTVAIVGKFADAGIDASRAGTALNAILSQFSNPASKFREELAAAGITTSNFEDALYQLAAAGPAGSKAIIAVGQEAGPALRALLNRGTGALDALIERLKNAEGSAAATAAVMQNNLNGAFNGLASAWDTVKNALGTPVLPVLKEGVEQLAAAFRNAVADGTVTKFGESIATAFKTGIQFVRDFIGTVDFGAVLTRLQDFANSANETFTRVGEYATNAGNTIKLAYGVMSAGVNAVLTAIYGIGSVFAEVAASVMKGVALLREGLASITFGTLSESFALAAEDARNAAQGFGEAAQAMRDKAAAALQDTATAAQTARDGFAGLAGAADGAKAATDGWAAAVAKAAAEIEAAGKAQGEANAKAQAAKKAADDQAAATTAAKNAVAALRLEYQAAVDSKNWQEAARIQGELRKALDGAKVSADALAGAFKTLKLKTTEELEETASNAERAWGTVTKAGVTSASTLTQAFSAYANAALEAAERQGEAAVKATRSMLEAKAAAAGLRLEVSDGGGVIVRSMREAAAATESAGSAARGAAGGYRDMAGAAQQAAESAKKLQEIYDRNKVGNGSDKVGKSGDVREAAVMQYDINQDIAKRYGDDAVGNDLAEQAWQLRQLQQSYQKNYGGARSQQSLLQQRNIGAELTRVEAELKASMGGGEVGGGTGGPASRPAPAGPSTGTPTVVNINVEGVRRSIETNAQGARDLQDLIRQLQDDKGRS